MKHEESLIQAEIVKFLSSVGVFCHSVANEAAGNNVVRQGQMITMGLRPGVADLVAWMPSGVAYIEVKTQSGRQSPAQIKFELKCRDFGVPYYLVRSLEEMEKIVKKSLKK
jgi:hypothetical protein